MVRWLCQIGPGCEGLRHRIRRRRRRGGRSRSSGQAPDRRRRRQRSAEEAKRCVNSPASTPNSTKPPPPTASSRRCRTTSSTPRPENAAWAVYFLAGGKPRQAVPTKLLRQYAIEYARPGRLAVRRMLRRRRRHGRDHRPHPAAARRAHSDIGLAVWMEERIGPLRGADPGTIRAALFSYWDELTWRERFLFVKLIGGGFRVGVSKLLVTRALAAHRRRRRQADRAAPDGLDRRPRAPDGGRLPAADRGAVGRRAQAARRPALSLLPRAPAAGRARPTLGDMGDWQVEWKYDGIRAQLVRRGGQNYLWSRGEDLITERFPGTGRAAACRKGRWSTAKC